MKIYSLPKALPAPETDYANFDMALETAREDKHKADLKAYFIAQGYTGKHTGKIVCFPVADGRAQYMMVDGSKSFLVHLPYGDAWHYRDAQFLPKAEIVRRLKAQEAINKLFSKK